METSRSLDSDKLKVVDTPVNRKLGKVFDTLGMEAYLVGGIVRDVLLERPTKDVDIVVVGSGIEAAQAAAKELGVAKVSVFKNFGTAMFCYEDTDYEFVGARKESYQRDSRKPIVEDGTLTDDQNRRDFTINALAICLNQDRFGELVDPFGGRMHLDEGLIKTPLQPEETFSDDPLRMMRAIRFASQLGFRIEPNTLEAIKSQRERIHIISAERITDELNKIILSPRPSVGFKLLFDTGLLEIIFPEMHKLQGVKVIDGVSHKDNFYHTIEVVDNVAKRSDNLWLRWSAVLHDIAKPATQRFHKVHGWTFHGHEDLGSRWVPRIFKRMRLPLDHKMKYVQKLVALHLRPIALTKEEITDSALRRLLFDAGEDLEDLMTLCESDITSKNKKKVVRYLERFQTVREKLKDVEERDRIRNWQPPVSGELIMSTFGIGPCKAIGDLKKAVKNAILDGEIPNNFEDAYNFVVAKGVELGLTLQKHHLNEGH